MQSHYTAAVALGWCCQNSPVCDPIRVTKHGSPMNQKISGDGPEETRLARRAKTISQISAGAMIPSMFLVGIVGGYLLGAWIQGRVGGEPWWGIGFAVLGGVASVRKVIQMMRAESLSHKDEDQRGDESKS